MGSLLPMPAETSFQEQNFGVFDDVTTEVIYSAYEAQEEFCITNEDLVNNMIAEMQSGELSAETVELMEISMFEVAVFLETNVVTSSRRNLFFREAVQGAIDGIYTATYYLGGLSIIMWNNIFIAADDFGDWVGGLFGRRQLAALTNRLMNQELTLSGASRRAFD